MFSNSVDICFCERIEKISLYLMKLCVEFWGFLFWLTVVNARACLWSSDVTMSLCVIRYDYVYDYYKKIAIIDTISIFLQNGSLDSNGSHSIGLCLPCIVLRGS